MKRKAEHLFYLKRLLDDGGIVEMSIWRVPSPVPGSSHDLKYSLFYGREGRRLIGYDNERGKGDHRHRGGDEEPYILVDADRLVTDFLADIHRIRNEHADET